VRFLLRDKRVDPTSMKNLAIKWAISNGHIEIVKLLLQDSRVKIHDINKSTIGFNAILKINREIKLEKLLQHDRRV